MRPFLVFAVLGAAAARAAVPAPELLPHYEMARDPAEDPLQAAVTAFRADALPAAQAFLSVSRSTGVPIALDPDVKGQVSLEVRGGTASDLLDAICRSLGLSWEREGKLVVVHRQVMRLYPIDYPQMTRSAQGASTVVLSAQTGSSANSPTQASGAAQAGATSSNDQTNISIQQSNQTSFWADLQAELSAIAQTGESATVNKLAGLAVVVAAPARQEQFRSLIASLNRRICRQVRITARVVEVRLDSEHKLGVDWSAAATRVGGLHLTGISTATSFTTLAGQTLGSDAVSGTVSTGSVSALVSAIAEQGQVHAVSNPSVVSLSNQTAFVKVGTEQTFFTQSNSTTVTQSTTGTPYSTTQSNYSQNAITIGTVLYVTPVVNEDGTVTVDVLPAITQLVGIDTSPDGQQTAPRMDIKSLSTIARLHPGQSVVIGGLIYDSSAGQRNAVPVLGSLPLVGGAFGTSARVTSRSELVIFLTAEALP